MLPTGKKGIGSVSDRSRPLSFAVLTGLAALAGPAAAQDFTAGKTAAQLFQSDCSACHKSPAGLAKGMDARSVATFLKEHYTTKEESAVALAGFLAGVRGGGDARQNAPGAATPNGPKPKTAARGAENEPEAKPEARPAPRPRVSIPVEPRQPEAEGPNPREERRQARTP